MGSLDKNITKVIEEGNIVTMIYANGDRYYYQIIEWKIVDGEEKKVLKEIENNKKHWFLKENNAFFKSNIYLIISKN